MANSLDNNLASGAALCDPQLKQLYERAFKEFGVRALWNMRQFDEPTVADVLATARQLRQEGNMAARYLAEELERGARAHH